MYDRSKYANVVDSIDNEFSSQTKSLPNINPINLKSNYVDLCKAVGPRLCKESFSTFEQLTPAIKKVAKRVQEYAKDIDNQWKESVGLLLYGNAGNGKDHLVMSVAREACKCGYTIGFINGPVLRSKLRVVLGSEDEESFVKSLVEPHFLWVSDLIMSGDVLSPYQLDMWYRIVDRRWQLERPIWLTVNGENSEDIGKMGVPALDRIMHNSLVEFCSWGSYRKKKV